MGIVQTQSIKNTIITFIGFGIGAINALFLYTTFLGKLHYGIVSTLLSGANIMMPIMAFGVQNTLIRFFSTYKTDREKEVFLTFMLFLPLVFIIPIGIGFYLFYDQISYSWLAENPSLKPFFGLIPVIGIFMAYFEIFYAWAKVHMQSVVGNLISEVLVRVVVFGLLFSVYLEWITKSQFVYALTFAYFLQMLAMKLYAFRVKFPLLKLEIPSNIKEIVTYSLFIIVSGGVAVMLVDFDKVMIPQYQNISQNALYAVAIFISTVIIVPSRAMTQIVAPITAKLIAENKHDELNDLYKKSAINLQVVGGLLMLLIFLNIKQLYYIIPDDYRGGIWVVFLIGIGKFYDLILGNNNSIIVNTHYYRTVLLFGFGTVLLMIVLNMYFIPRYGIVGSAIATLITMVIYNTVKLLFVVQKMNLFPFTLKTLVSLGIIIVLFLGFFFWDFGFHPIINIILKSILVVILYVLINYKLNISQEFKTVVNLILQKFKLV